MVAHEYPITIYYNYWRTNLMGLFSRNKGKVGERELAHELSRLFGVSARRGVQFQGSPDSPDVVTEIPDLHIECKRTERFRLYEALDQAVEDAGATKVKVPVVCHRQNKKPWVAIVKLDDLPRLAEILVTNQQSTISKGDDHADNT
jgi:Holliday junction resolvase